MKSRLAVSEALYLKPLLFGLEKPESPFELVVDIPSRNALKFSDRSGEIRNAFLSPIDYARHGAEYCMVPDVAVSSTSRSDTIQLIVKQDVRDIRSIAVDIRGTSEIILAKIILLEKFRSTPSKESDLQFIPMARDVPSMLARADAALVLNFMPDLHPSGVFALDLVEEWFDLTGLPYVHGFWVGREEESTMDEIQALVAAKKQGTALVTKIAEHGASAIGMKKADAVQYFSSFSYNLGEPEKESLSEFVRYSYFHGAIGDLPDLNFFEIPTPLSPSLN